ncbi:MAG TPA: hypothetical protein VK752_10355 [Bryobacteraceae bacterium]|jgi:hypothetical protein|nr:hypothetical protein [Bryobacteraceae bacterium]
MKRLVLASIFCLAFAAVSRAQDKAQPPQIMPPVNLKLEFPPKTAAPSVSGIVQGLDLRGKLPPNSLDLTFKVNPSGVCSVPLLEAHVTTSDPGMAFTPANIAVPMPQARVPAPACQK